jgi:predicted ATPase
VKLLKLSLTGDYKGLSNQTFDFSQTSGNVLAFIGLNGSGKSQLLELIAEVFAYLERKKRRDFKVRNRLPFEVAIEFRIRTFVDRDEQHEYRIQLHADGNVTAQTLVDGDWFQRSLAETPLPAHIVGYASGLNENLQRAFLKNALQYFDVMATRAARRKRLAGEIDEKQDEEINRYYLQRYPGIFGEEYAVDRLSFREGDTAIPAAIFLDYDCNALLMASLALLPQEALDSLFPDIPFRYPHKIVLQYDLRKAPVEEDAIRDIRQLIREVGVNSVVGLCRKTSDVEFNVYELDYLAANITIDFGSRDLKDRLREVYYNEPLQLFQKLYKLQLLGAQHWQAGDKKCLRNDAFDGNVKKPLKTKLPLSVIELKLSNGQSLIDFDDLSDGEAQLVQVLGAAHIFRRESTLFLFDEPETHLNPSWRTNFHLHLIQSLDASTQVQAVLSTHSPFLISSLRKENVFRFERRGLRTEMAPVVSETFGASFDVLIKQYFALKSTISQTAVTEILQHLNDQTLTDATRRQWIDESMGDSMEKAYLLRKLQQ